MRLGTSRAGCAGNGSGLEIATSNAAVVSILLCKFAGLLLCESHTGRPHNRLTASNRSDWFLRRTSLSSLNPQSSILAPTTPPLADKR